MAWDPKLASIYVDSLVQEMPTWANDMTEDIERLKRVTDEDLAHPALMRAFFRGACGWDPATDCSMIFFYAICLGDPFVFDDLLTKHERMERSNDEKAIKAWHRAQDAFWARADIEELRRVAESVPGTVEARQ